jgi:hypothetical protein
MLVYTHDNSTGSDLIIYIKVNKFEPGQPLVVIVMNTIIIKPHLKFVFLNVMFSSSV